MPDSPSCPEVIPFLSPIPMAESGLSHSPFLPGTSKPVPPQAGCSACVWKSTTAFGFKWLFTLSIYLKE